MSDDGNDKFTYPIFHGDNQPHPLKKLPDPPPWRQFDERARVERGKSFKVTPEAVELVNAALLLRRPLLVTGKPGTGKTSLAYAVAHELQLGKVLSWPITTRSTLQQGLYNYDAIARLQDASLQHSAAPPTTPAGAGVPGAAPEPADVGRYIRLGPLGTALLPSDLPRVLLIDEIDKSDIDLPNDLLNVFEEGEFEIPELSRLPEGGAADVILVQPNDGGPKVPVTRGIVRCRAFPLVILTSNGEREFPPAFLRRCLRLQVPLPTGAELADIVRARLAPDPRFAPLVEQLVAEFLDRRDGAAGAKHELATDQLLNAVYLVTQGIKPMERDQLREALLKSLSEA